MSIGTVTSVLLATALTVAIANVGQRLQSHFSQIVTGQNDCDSNPGAACAATPRPEFQGSRCSLPPDRDV